MNKRDPKRVAGIKGVFEHRIEGTSAVRLVREMRTSDSVTQTYSYHPDKAEVRVRRVERQDAQPAKLNVVEATGRFRPDNASTLSVTVIGDCIDHRMSVRSDDRKMMRRVLGYLDSKLGEGDD